MFCRKCGNEMPDDSVFCGKCGTNQESGAAPPAQSAQSAYQAPSFEFKTVRCYPSDATESRYKSFYENCGWTIVDMDRKQQYTGQSADGTRHYSTQTHIKMQRDKNRPNYEQIRDLSAQAEAYFDTTSKSGSVGKGVKSAFIGLLIPGIVLSVLGIMFFGFFGLLLGAGWFIAILGVIFVAIGVVLIAAAIIIRVATAKKIAEQKAAIDASYAASKAKADAAYEECRKLVNGS